MARTGKGSSSSSKREAAWTSEPALVKSEQLVEQLRVMINQVQEKYGGAKAGAVDRTNLKLRWRGGGRHHVEW